jgi:AraC-like DNA-binding protein
LGEYRRVLKGELFFGKPHNRLVFPVADASLPVIGYNRELLEWFRQLAEGMLQKAGESQTSTQTVQKFLVENFKGQLPSLPETASALHTTTRSLQRRLKDEGTSFGDLRDQIRQDLAAGLLASNKFTVSEIAYMLGYAGPANFRRAFKRWEGVNPGQYGG